MIIYRKNNYYIEGGIYEKEKYNIFNNNSNNSYISIFYNSKNTRKRLNKYYEKIVSKK